MRVASTLGVSLTGLKGDLVHIEADITNQTPRFVLIGLPDKALGEAQLRVHNASANCAMPLPNRRITVNLTPASLPKHGSGFDVGIAIAAAATGGGFDLHSVARTVHIGELGLDGRLRPVPGVLPAVLAAARAGVEHVVVPFANLDEARLVDGIHVHGAVSLADVARLHGAEVDDPALEPVTAGSRTAAAAPPPELGEVVGQREAVGAMLVAAAGGHHVLLSGPPGAGKTMLAARMSGILPPLDDAAALEVAAIRSLSGDRVQALSRIPPFEAPHHSASVASLIGGGSGIVRPGAIARATHGVLFLDEAGEFPRSSLDALRQPLETGAITIHRAGVTAHFPARFQLLLATNPCPCGRYGVAGAECTCPPMAVRRYQSRLSGPLLDRVDIQLGVQRVGIADLAGEETVTTDAARTTVEAARARATHRLRGTPWTLNAQVPGTWLRDGPRSLPAAVRRPLDTALHRGAITLRGYDRVLRVAWSVADLAGHDAPDLHDIGRALFLKKGIAA